MRQRLGLLAGQDKAARFRTRQRHLTIPVVDLMAFPFGHCLAAR